jgi:glutaminase
MSDTTATDNKSNDKTSLNGMLNRLKSAVAPLRDTLRDLHTKYQPLLDGKVADYIPELAKADPNWFAICAVTADGNVYEFGDYNQLFTIQSVSKPFVFGLALEDHGRENVLKKVGVEPTGEAFNAIVLDEASNRPLQPDGQCGRDRDSRSCQRQGLPRPRHPTHADV